jgi:hypothetical protein
VTVAAAVTGWCVSSIAGPLAPPSYTVGTENGSSAEPDYFQHYTVTLNKGEQFVLLIHASLALAEYCQFSLNMSVDDGSSTVNQDINNNGKPFAITGTCVAPSANPFSCYRDLYISGPPAEEFDPQSEYQREGHRCGLRSILRLSRIDPRHRLTLVRRQGADCLPRSRLAKNRSRASRLSRWAALALARLRQATRVTASRLRTHSAT